MPKDMQLELWRALVTAGVLIIGAATLYLVALLQRMKHDLDDRAKANAERDAQRNEVQENVRRLVNSTGVQHDNQYVPLSQSLMNGIHRNLPGVLMACMAVMLFYQVFSEPRRRVAAVPLLEGK